MKIALYNLEPKIENTAMMQVSQYHKKRGDQVSLYSPLFHREYDKVYCFSIFQFTSKRTVTSDMICGGTGFNITSRLQPEIEECDLDYSIFPNCKTSYLWFSRGCIRSCPFCVVPTKEGHIHPVLPKNLNPNSQYISVMDNNFFANRLYEDAIDYLESLKQPVDFQCGFDARLWRREFGEELKRLRFWKQVRTAWDDPKEDLTDKLEEMAQSLGKSKIMVYVLIGYWSTPQEDLDRVLAIRKLGLDVWVMPFNKRDPYQKAFDRWNNRHIGCEWKDYEHGNWKRQNNLKICE